MHACTHELLPGIAPLSGALIADSPLGASAHMQEPTVWANGVGPRHCKRHDDELSSEAAGEGDDHLKGCHSGEHHDLGQLVEAHRVDL